MSIRNKKDAIGQEILAYFEGRESFEICERDDGWIGISGGAKAYFAEPKDWPGFQKRGLRFARGRVLDVGAGAGRVSLYLQKKGCDVLAIDTSPLAIRVCKKRGVKKARILSFEDVGTLPKSSIDTVVMYGNNFGLFGSFDKAKRLLKDIHRVTSADARIIAETRDPIQTNDPAHKAYHRYNLKRGRMPGQIGLRIRFREYCSDWFDYLTVTKKEMEKIMHGTGWRIKKFIDSPEGWMYVAIIEKQKI